MSIAEIVVTVCAICAVAGFGLVIAALTVLIAGINRMFSGHGGEE